MGESIIGDITPHCGVSDQTKAEIELAAVNKLISFLPTAKGDDIKSLFLVTGKYGLISSSLNIIAMFADMGVKLLAFIPGIRRRSNERSEVGQRSG